MNSFLPTSMSELTSYPPKQNITLCSALYSVAIEAGPAVTAISTGVVLAVSKLGTRVSPARTSPEVVGEHCRHGKMQ